MLQYNSFPPKKPLTLLYISYTFTAQLILNEATFKNKLHTNIKEANAC